MTPEKTEISATPRIEDVKKMAQESGWCLSVLLPLEAGTDILRTTATRLRASLHSARQKLLQEGLTAAEAENFLEPVRQLVESPTVEPGTQTQSLALYRSPDHVWRFDLTYPVAELISIGEYFHVLPLLKGLETQPEFYLLALSQKHARLMHCTQSSSEEVPLPPSVPQNLSDFSQHAQPDHRLENRAHGGQKGKAHGSSPGLIVAFGTGSDSDEKDEYLYHFYNELDKQLQTLLRDAPLPLVVAGVDYEIALYHRVSEYPNLVSGGVHGAPDGLKGGELHARALEVLRSHDGDRAAKALAQYEKAGGERMSTDVAAIVTLAFDGRILHLFLADGAEQPGTFDENTRQARMENGSNDLLNLAALQTITHGGNVFVLPRERVPAGGNATCMLRF